MIELSICEDCSRPLSQKGMPVQSYECPRWPLSEGDPEPSAIIGCLRYALSSYKAQVTGLIRFRNELQGEIQEDTRLRERMSELLTGVANGLKGPPGPLMIHDWSRLPLLSTIMRQALMEARVLVDNAANHRRKCSDPSTGSSVNDGQEEVEALAQIDKALGEGGYEDL